MRSAVFFWILALACVKADDTSSDQGLLKALWKRLALEWKEKYERAENKSIGLAQRVAELEKEVGECQLLQLEQEAVPDHLPRESETTSITEPVNMEGEEFWVMLVSAKGSTNADDISMEITSIHDDDVIVHVSSPSKDSLYVVPPLGTVQLSLQVHEAAMTSQDCQVFQGMHITSAISLSAKVLLKGAGSTEEFPIAPAPTTPERRTSGEASVLLLAVSDIHGVDISDKDGNDVHSGTLGKGEHLFVPRESRLFLAGESQASEKKSIMDYLSGPNRYSIDHHTASLRSSVPNLDILMNGPGRTNNRKRSVRTSEGSTNGMTPSDDNAEMATDGAVLCI